MQHNELREIVLLDSPPDQQEFQVEAQQKRKQPSRRSSSKLSKGPMGRTGQQAVAGTASTSRVTSEPRNPGQEGLGSYQQADSRLAEHRTSSAGIAHDQGDPVDDVEGQPSRSDDEAMSHQSDCEDESNSVGSHSAEDIDGHASDPLRSAGDQAAGASRVVDSVHPLRLASTGASSGESVPTTSTTAGRSSESAVSVVQRPLTRAVSTRASSAATKSRALLACTSTPVTSASERSSETVSGKAQGIWVHDR